jgi:hypothetical protein
MIEIKELEKILKLCRKQGVMEISLEGLSFKLGDLPVENFRAGTVQESDPVDPYKNFPTGDLSPEQLLFYSAGGLPADDPYRSDQQ